MSVDANHSLNEFLNALAARQPAPGGGSVAALAGALAAAMGEMVLNYSIGKKDLADHQPALLAALAELERARAMLLELLVEDQLAFEKLTIAKRAGSGAGDTNPEFAATVWVCIRVPQAIGATALAIVQLCERISPIVNHFLLSDLAVCAELAIATVRCATYNVRVNLGELSDPEAKALTVKQTEHLVERGVAAIRVAIPAIWQRVGG